MRYSRHALPLDIPEKVRLKAASLGETGRAWLAHLPRQVADLERRWEIEAGPSYRHASEAFVAAARTHDGREVVLKIVMPGIDPTHQELRTLRVAHGKGYAMLLHAGEDENALLLEKLGAQLHELDLPADRQIEIICDTLREAWITLPEVSPLTTGAEKAAELALMIESGSSALRELCSERAIGLALSYAERRRQAFDPVQSVLVHGDAHEWNTLCAPGSTTGFKFVDPDGAYAERAFDLAISMREWGTVIPSGDLLRMGRRRCRLLADLSGAEPEPIWEWGMIQCVANGVALLRIGLVAAASVPLAMADAWAAAGDWTGV
jgi:streptomycin 6-kinase